MLRLFSFCKNIDLIKKYVFIKNKIKNASWKKSEEYKVAKICLWISRFRYAHIFNV